MGLVDHARAELKSMIESEEEMDRAMAEDVLQLIAVFAEQGHSGMSAPMCVALFKQLAEFKPIGPLTGEDGEWVEVGADGMKQNRRCGRVFKDAEGNCYDIDGYVFEDPKGMRFTSFKSRRPVVFPYVPLTEYVKVDAEGNLLQ